MKQVYRFAESRRLWQQALRLIPGGSQATRRPECADWPAYFTRAHGCRMWDVDGNEYIDYLCSIGPIILGYAYPRVEAAVRAMMRSAYQSSMNHPVQLELARLLTAMIPCAEQVRFMKSGTDATVSAARLARFITRRKAIARHGYHGWADMWFGDRKDSGVDQAASKHVFPFDGSAADLESLFHRHKEPFAAVIVCPVDTRPFTTANFREIVRIARRHGALAIFDEVKSGFRMAPGGAQEWLGVTPDLSTVSKAIANGYPLSAVVGRRRWMRHMDGAQVVGTFAVEGLALAAAVATLREIRERRVPRRLQRVGQRLIDGLNRITLAQGLPFRAFPDPLPCVPRFSFRNDDGLDEGALSRWFARDVCRRGVFWSSWHVAFVNFSHQDRDIDRTLVICEDTLRRMKQRIKKGTFHDPS